MKKRIKLISLSSSEVDLKYWHPESKEDVFICLDIEVGQHGEDGSNMFYVTLTTPEALRKRRSEHVLSRGRILIVDDYDYDLVRKLVLEIIAGCSAMQWDDSCAYLQRYFQWEYEDYIDT